MYITMPMVMSLRFMLQRYIIILKYAKNLKQKRGGVTLRYSLRPTRQMMVIVSLRVSTIPRQRHPRLHCRRCCLRDRATMTACALSLQALAVSSNLFCSYVEIISNRKTLILIFELVDSQIVNQLEQIAVIHKP